MAEQTNVTQSKRLVRSPFTITKSTDGSTWLSADLATEAAWNTVLTYSVPLGTAIEITPQNYHFGDFNATDTTTAITGGVTRIVKTNAAGTETREIWLGSNGIFKDIGDAFQRPQLKVSVVVNASQKLKVEVYNLGTTLDSASSDFFIECFQYYEEI